MLRQEKAPSKARGGGVIGVTSTDKTTAHPQYSRIRPKTQYNPDLGNLVDQAISLAEFHEVEAEFHREQAQRHAENAEQHRAILRELQTLIPRYQFTEGGRHD